MYIWLFLEGDSEDVWDTVKVSFEIEKVTAALFCKETSKVGYY